MDFMEWIKSAESIIALISAGVGLIGTLVGAFFAVKNWIKALKTKKASEIWSMIMSMADSAMKEAEASGKAGADKKAMVIEAVKAGCKAGGIDLDSFLDQLSAYIDQCIKFANDLTDAKK